jgi:serine/threonine-protein kinase
MTESFAQLKSVLADRYEIQREVGQGGMATVYLAQDVKHDRMVALKVLKPELAAVIGAERFLAEIRVTANLQHPNILPLYDSGEAESFLYYVMPYVEGDTLRDKLDREKQLGIEAAVELTRSVAAALDYAHRHDVIHRDIKPGNILLHDGQAMVADFGIALAVSHAGGARLTETGLSIGTPHYMSPEQAMGDRELDARSDVYSLGAMLYEMLTGDPPYTGSTAQAIVAKVITEKAPPVTAARDTVPPHVSAAIATSLNKLPADRFASAAEFSAALKDPGFSVPVQSAAILAGAPAPGHAGSPLRRLLPWAVAGLAVVAGVVGGRLTSRAEPEPSVVGRFTIGTDSTHRFPGAPYRLLALSPQGDAVAYVGMGTQGPLLYLRRLDQLAPMPMPGTEGAISPFFTPDGRWVAFYAGNTLKKIAVTGGAPVTVQNAPYSGYPSSVWLPDGALLTVTGDGALRRLDVDGTLSVVAAPDSAQGETALYVSDVLPDGRTVLLTAATQGATNGRGIALDIESGERTVLVDAAINAMAYDDGYLLWAQPDGALIAAAFDAGSLEVTGSPVTLAQDVRISVGGPAHLSVSRNGSLAYVPESPFSLVLVDRQGNREVVSDLRRRFHSPRTSPDGRHIAVDFSYQGSRDVWTLDLRQNTLTRLTFANDGHDPVWSPDGRTVAYASAPAGVVGVFLQKADGSGVSERFFVGDLPMTAGAFTSGGNQILTIPLGRDGSWDIGTVSNPDAPESAALLVTPFNEGWPALSPDGRWLAYGSDESGQLEVYVRPYPGPGAKVLVSQNGGREPVWSRDGRELYYVGFEQQASQLVAVGVETEPEFRVRSRVALFDASEYEPADPHANYDVGPDGRFVMVHQGRLSEMVMVLNWTEEVRRRTTTAN